MTEIKEIKETKKDNMIDRKQIGYASVEKEEKQD